jgi:hypothetical protein
MSAQPIVLKDLHRQQRIPGGIALREGMRFARQSGQSIPQAPVESLHMHGAGDRHQIAQRRTSLDGHQMAVLIAVLDRLGQLDVRWHDPSRSSPLARWRRPAVLLGEDVAIALPAIAAPGERCLLGPVSRLGNRIRNQRLADPSSGGGHNEATRSILHEAAPALAGVGFVWLPVFLRTNDQNSSISTVVRCRSRTKTAVMAAPWAAARCSQTLIVAY